MEKVKLNKRLQSLKLKRRARYEIFRINLIKMADMAESIEVRKAARKMRRNTLSGFFSFDNDKVHGYSRKEYNALLQKLNDTGLVNASAGY